MTSLDSVEINLIKLQLRVLLRTISVLILIEIRFQYKNIWMNVSTHTYQIFLFVTYLYLIFFSHSWTKISEDTSEVI